MSTIDEIAPYPEREEDVTAQVMAKHFVAFAQLHWRLGLEHTDRDQAAESSRAFVSYYAIAFLLHQVGDAGGIGAADRAARALWEAWENPHTMGPDVWEWLTEYGIDPEAVNKVADGLHAADQAKAAQSEQSSTGGAA